MFPRKQTAMKASLQNSTHGRMLAKILNGPITHANEKLWHRNKNDIPVQCVNVLLGDI